MLAVLALRPHCIRAMSVESVRRFFEANAPDISISEPGGSTATVALAASVHQVEPAQIAKTLAVRLKTGDVLVVMCGDMRLDNRKMKDAFGCKPRMLSAEEVSAVTGHPIGGVCPFGLSRPLPIYLDNSLRAFEEVIPAAGSSQTAVRISPTRMAELVDGIWVDVCSR